MLDLLLGVGIPAPIKQDTLTLITKEPPAIVQTVAPVEPTLAQKISSNYYSCNTETHFIRADNATCLLKPQSSTSRAQNTATRPQNGSYSNDMMPGYCTFWAKSQRPDLPRGLGNANTWFARATSMGVPTGTIPRVGAVATTTRGSEGHVSIVVEVLGDKIYVSEMNVEGWNILSYAWYPASDYLYIY